MKRLDLTGQKFGRLTVLSLARIDPKDHACYWNCLCDCGNTAVSWGGGLKYRSIQSCGCLRSEVVSRKFFKHGHSNPPTTEYRSWRNMLTRCTNPKVPCFVHYGGRGIRVCDRWKSFDSFLADMGPKPSPAHSIERNDNDGNYEPSNCRWATRREQQRNKRRAYSRPVMELAAVLGGAYRCAY